MLFGRRHRHRLRFFLVLQLFCGAIALSGIGSIEVAEAREPGARRAIAPLLQSSRPLRIGVVGDSVAGDLARGLHKLLRTRDNIGVIKFTKPATGLMRDDVYDWGPALESFVRRYKLDVIAVMIGGNDRQSIWMNGRRLVFGSGEWQAEYERRVARFMAILATEKANVYWIGLPIVRSDEVAKAYRTLNRIFESQAKKFGLTYIDTWTVFADTSGGYSSFGRDLEDVKRRLRKSDGFHFTIEGELLLAHIVARAIARDLGAKKPAN
jgi:hypothetical protein